MKTKYIRYSRIIKHFIQCVVTKNELYRNEVSHYYYMKTFKDI